MMRVSPACGWYAQVALAREMVTWLPDAAREMLLTTALVGACEVPPDTMMSLSKDWFTPVRR